MFEADKTHSYKFTIFTLQGMYSVTSNIDLVFFFFRDLIMWTVDFLKLGSDTLANHQIQDLGPKPALL